MLTGLPYSSSSLVLKKIVLHESYHEFLLKLHNNQISSTRSSTLVVKPWRLAKIGLFWWSLFRIIFIFNHLVFPRFCITERSIRNIIFLCNLLFLQRRIRKVFFEVAWSFRLSGNLFCEGRKEFFPDRISGSDGDSDRESQPGCESESDSEPEFEPGSSSEEVPFSVSSIRQGRCVQLGSTIRVNHSRRFRLHWNLIYPMMSVTLLNQRHARTFCGGVAVRAILAKNVSTFAPIAQHHLFHKRATPWDAIATTSMDSPLRGKFWHVLFHCYCSY